MTLADRIIYRASVVMAVGGSLFLAVGVNFAAVMRQLPPM